ncbi:hypothetical protein [Amycolatopsis minnesotensis]|uniref:Uncharacterized protein n=1 Tax=Amycolatopsis minnesotensis TaxID=337894 RepID=A0ABN2RPP6_9PSEU
MAGAATSLMTVPSAGPAEGARGQPALVRVHHDLLTGAVIRSGRPSRVGSLSAILVPDSAQPPPKSVTPVTGPVSPV